MRWRRDNVAEVHAGGGVSLTSATVTMPGGSHEKVAVVLRPGTDRIRVTKSLTVLEHRAGVVGCDRMPGRVPSWRISFDDGTEWTVRRTRQGCVPCGR